MECPGKCGVPLSLLWFWGVVPVRVSFIGQIDILENY